MKVNYKKGFPLMCRFDNKLFMNLTAWLHYYFAIMIYEIIMSVVILEFIGLFCLSHFVLSYCECFVTRCHYKQKIFVLSFPQAWYFEKTFIHGARLITKVSKIF